jgi:hypothetical protein
MAVQSEHRWIRHVNENDRQEELQRVTDTYFNSRSLDKNIARTKDIFKNWNRNSVYGTEQSMYKDILNDKNGIRIKIIRSEEPFYGVSLARQTRTGFSICRH